MIIGITEGISRSISSNTRPEILSTWQRSLIFFGNPGIPYPTILYNHQDTFH